MVLDMFSPLTVVSWASARGNCRMHYTINNADEMVIIFDGGTSEFEFAFDVHALREVVRLGTDALAEMDVLAEGERDAASATAEDRSS